MNETQYLLIPEWHFEHDSDIPPYFMKLFSSKKEIEDYLNNNDIRKELVEIKNKATAERIKRLNLQGEERIKEMARAFTYSDITFWVIAINPIDKENRIGLMQHDLDRKKDKLTWKYASYFGGKVWKDDLLFGQYR